VKLSKCARSRALFAFRTVTTRPGAFRSRPTRLVAWSLDVLGDALGLAHDHHQREPGHIDTDGDHVGRQEHVDHPCLVVQQLQLIEDAPDVLL
jgi:hypothetical protein